MYLIDTNVISERRKGRRANAGVQAFFEEAELDGQPLFLSVVTMGELRRGVELKRFRGDRQQCRLLDEWLLSLQRRYAAISLASMAGSSSCGAIFACRIPSMHWTS